MTRTPLVVAYVLAAMFGLAACSQPPADTALEPTGTQATWGKADGLLTVGMELQNTGAGTLVVGSAQPIAGFEEIATEVSFGERNFWIEDPEDLRPVPAQLAPGEVAAVYVRLQVADCGLIGEWEEEEDGTVRFVASGGESLAVEVWWSDQPEETVLYPLELVPALQIKVLDAEICR